MDVPDLSRVELSEAALAVNSSMQDLAALTQSQTPLQVQMLAPDAHSYGLAQLATVDWTGPVEPLVQRLGQITRYRVKVIGDEPVLPIVVNISKRNTAVGDILREAALQSREQMQIQVFPANQLIELHYL